MPNYCKLFATLATASLLWLSVQAWAASTVVEIVATRASASC